MNSTVTNAVTVIALFGGSLAIFTTLAAIERLARGIGRWLASRSRDGVEP